MVKRACDACHVRRTKVGANRRKPDSVCPRADRSGSPVWRWSTLYLMSEERTEVSIRGQTQEARTSRQVGLFVLPGRCCYMYVEELITVRIINMLQLQEETCSEHGATGHSDEDAAGILQVAPQDNDSVPTSALTTKTKSPSPLTDLTHILEDLLRSASRASNPLADSSLSRQRHSKAAIVNLMRPLLATTLETYVTQIYPLSPIVDVSSVMTRFQSNAQLYDPKFAALLLSLCAQAALLPGSTTAIEDEGQADDMVEMAVGLHNTADLGDRPTLEAIATSLSISAYLGARRGPGASMVKRKEATALAELMGLDRRETSDQLDETEREIALTLFWKLLVGERYVKFSGAMADLGKIFLPRSIVASSFCWPGLAITSVPQDTLHPSPDAYHEAVHALRSRISGVPQRALLPFAHPSHVSG